MMEPYLSGLVILGLECWIIIHISMAIFSFICQCFCSNGTTKCPSVPLESEVPSSRSQSVPAVSEVLRSHGQPVLVDSEIMNSNYNGSKFFEYSELKEATDDFDPNRKLGSGGYGTVYLGTLKDGQPVAIKYLHEDRFKSLRLHDKKLEGERLRRFMNEVDMLTPLSHQNLVQLYGCTSPDTYELLLVQEYISNGTVARHLLKSKSALPWPTRLNIAVQTASALAYLHSCNVIHRDVKTSNVLLDNSFNAKVADFGLSRLFPLGVTHITTDPAGTPGYIDPEYFEHCHLSDKSDVYSFGVVMIELISSLPAFSEDEKQPYLSDFAINKIVCGQLQYVVDPALGFKSDDWTSQTISAVAELAFRCLQRHRDMRPSMAEVLNTLESIRGGSPDSVLTWGSNSDYNAAKVHIVSRLPDDYFEKK